MATYITRLQLLETLKQKNITLFTLSDLKKIFSFSSKDTLIHMVRRLKKDRIIEKLTRSKYLFLHGRKVSDFELANFLVVPSYVSLESALSYYGIITQFPYHISSLTLGKSRIIKSRNKIFQYSQIKNEYFKDFVKIENFLLASREKAIFDYLYFIYKGLRPISKFDDLAIYLKEKSIRRYITNNAKQKLIRFFKKHAKL